MGPEEGHKNIGGMEDLSYEGRLRALGFVSLEKSRLQGDLTAAFQYLKRGYKKDRNFLPRLVVIGQGVYQSTHQSIPNLMLSQSDWVYERQVLSSFYDKMTHLVDHGKDVDVIYLEKLAAHSSRWAYSSLAENLAGEPGPKYYSEWN
ncbi:hypothetical protein llap_4176 [Limosa lapponica baueri]|uniref:Uncharacterized protein n=1 Tax=Limosa lapponica baueri TaxID=1758121 RepID=A0A2I0UHM5_LIMLA|nr:hypothetical protein llap_4176 [Limosa lapponica baueri]